MLRKKKPRKHHRQKCRGKVRYRDHGEAVQALHVLANNSTRTKIPKRAYPCEHCDGWHVASSDHWDSRISDASA